MSEPRSDVRTALVTGVSKGIGRAIALRLLSDGWQVHGTYRSGRDEALALAAEHARCTVHQADLALDGDVEQLLSVLGDLPLAGLVNNAGLIHFEDLDAFDLSRWRETLEVNLTAPVRLARALESNLTGG
jgi:NAD(P)-dependent dehydrogenase (short-subunit alcohol dehydrogenase family)